MDNSMFTRSELEIKTLKQLKDLASRYGIKATGNPAYKTSWITSLMAFPVLAIQQIKQGRGLKSPTFVSFQALGTALDEMETPTLEQAALIKITMEGRRMSYSDRYDQERLLNLYKAKLHIEQAINLINH